MMNWKYIGGTGKPTVIDGVDIEKEKWIDTKQVVNVKDPLYGQTFSFTIWEINSPKKIVFAAGEFSNGIFGYYIKE